MDIKLSRAKLEELAHQYIDKSIEITKRAMEASGLKKAEIDEDYSRWWSNAHASHSEGGEGLIW
jgi:hypothetical protein